MSNLDRGRRTDRTIQDGREYREEPSGTGRRVYAIIALGPQENHSLPSPTVTTDGRATLAWDSVLGADAYFVLRDDRIITPPLRIEGSVKQWVDADKPLAPQRQP